jgi:hypothetical protein
VFESILQYIQAKTRMLAYVITIYPKNHRLAFGKAVSILSCASPSRDGRSYDRDRYYDAE